MSVIIMNGQQPAFFIVKRLMRYTQNDIEIFALLERAGRCEFDASVSCISDFEFEKEFHLFLFSPSGKHKGSHLFSFDKTAVPSEIENSLLPALLSLPDEDFSGLKNAALDIAEHLISSRKNDALFFDGH